LADYTVFENELVKSGVRFIRGECLSSHTTLGVGGSADFFIEAATVVDLVKVAEISRYCGVKSFFIGNGSNLLVSDSGFRGAAICTKGIDDVYIERETQSSVFVRAFCGATLQKLNTFYLANGISGAEFLCGIPGTVGGAVAMNSGFAGKNISDILVSAFSECGGRLVLKNKAECCFGYRKSVFNKRDAFVISALFRAKREHVSKIKDNILSYKSLRQNQPSGKTMGSVFKNGEIPAGKAIDSAGLKGLRIGGAHISEHHANFIVNDGTASSRDVYDLILTAKAVVKEKLGINLHEEIHYVGEFK
jgi:UDP-N-acetylmuramate dehydrogenase